MLIRVIVTEDGKLIRLSDGQQIGEVHIPLMQSAELSVYKVDDKLLDVQQGYIDETGEFHKLCIATACSLQCLNQNSPDCRYCRKGGETQGMYIDV